PSFKDLDSPEDDLVIVVDDTDEDEEDDVHTTTNAKTEDTSVPKSSSLSSLLTELKDLPSKFNELIEEVKGLKTQVPTLEIKIPGDLKEIPYKLDNFTKTVTSLTSEVAELKTLQWELPAEFPLLLAQNKEAKKFDFVTEEGEHIHLTKEQINQQKKIEEEAKSEVAKHESEIKTRMEYLYETQAELGINLEIPLSKQDPLNKLNDLANKKRKHVDDIHDYFKANKRLKSSVQYEDHLPSTVLNELVLGLDDRARTFSSLLIAEFDKRNLNLLKQMRVIEQLRQ
ncbi:hypothetical protein Tco_1097205, partial [Tanacetum coccineum]